MDLSPCPDTPAPLHPYPRVLQTKADSDVEKQMAVVNGKTKLAGEYDQKEKQLAIEQRM